MTTLDVREDDFPAPSRETTGTVGDVPTQITRLDFSDKILLTISQRGRLSQWIQVPLTGSSAGLVDMTLPTATTHSLLPSTHLTPKTLLGGGGEDRETLGQLYAAQIASQVSLRAPDDRRTLILGLGLEGAGAGSVQREAFYDLLELAQRVL
ncbi:hypothetical protein ACRE_025490 [Hapsidospora chrysogenum ATCC 11550]|uniref:Proteasome assembly chaperone 3 n=1 Tax=Hapsidospora chrysogenum (strain ATCC 11550 / CBS 779.69 / DSM 880 / IAM 14645 / JCM 23072 / IMI 49137) TaxID=857340 RepID=A0A086TBD1_HAPC1|nr:hypothetical protein ACRE_025490 [Hapsidospora chrysogenum ATCC 11550]